MLGMEYKPPQGSRDNGLTCWVILQLVGLNPSLYPVKKLLEKSERVLPYPVPNVTIKRKEVYDRVPRQESALDEMLTRRTRLIINGLDQPWDLIISLNCG